jgi:hypothetical protein
MIAEPKAISHGLVSTTATFGAFTGISAANAGAAEIASPATSDKTIFFIGACPFSFDRLSADPFAHHPLRTETRLRSTRTQKRVHCRKVEAPPLEHRKAKTAAFAAFLGISGLYRQKAN